MSISSEQFWVYRKIEQKVKLGGLLLLLVFFLLCRFSVQFSSVQSLSRVLLFATPWTTARQASLSITKSLSLLKLRPIELVMPSSHLILCFPLLLLPPIPPSIRVFYNESTLLMRWPEYWSFSFSISPSSHLILCCPLLLLPPIPPSIRVFSNESTLLMRWPKYWSFSFSINPSNEHVRAHYIILRTFEYV